jgi:hypothetical protein
MNEINHTNCLTLKNCLVFKNIPRSHLPGVLIIWKAEIAQTVLVSQIGYLLSMMPKINPRRYRLIYTENQTHMDKQGQNTSATWAGRAWCNKPDFDFNLFQNNSAYSPYTISKLLVLGLDQKPISFIKDLFPEKYWNF